MKHLWKFRSQFTLPDGNEFRRVRHTKIPRNFPENKVFDADGGCHSEGAGRGRNWWSQGGSGGNHDDVAPVTMSVTIWIAL